MALNTKVEEGRTLARLQDLKKWEDNPRFIKDEKYAKLKADILEVQELDPKTDGQFKPVVINEQGIIMAGNMRYEVYKELGKDWVWVSVVAVNNPRQFFALALRDNMHYGEYDDEKVAEYAIKYELEPIDMEMLEVDTGSTTVQAIVDKISPSGEDDEPVLQEIDSQAGFAYQVGPHVIRCGSDEKNTSIGPEFVDRIRQLYARTVGKPDRWKEITPAITELSQ